MEEEKDEREGRGAVREAAGLYVHVPFCLSRCPYCHFYSTVDPAFMPEWAVAVKKEAGLYQDCFGRFDTLYFGGGTPSLLPEAVLGELLESLHRVFPIAPTAEMTLEANPNDLTLEKLRGLKALGINRISLGVQSLNDRELLFLKRRHTAEEARKAIDLARAAGFNNLSLDLIYGLPGQNAGTWRETLEEIALLRPEHLSCYELTAETGTALGRDVQDGNVVLPGERERRAFFLQTSFWLEARGYEHYEVSNFSRGAAHQAQHNRKYWDRRRYLGLGPSAHSFDGARRWWNGRSLKQYLETLARDRRPAEGRETLSPEQERLETLMLGFRTRSGVALENLPSNPEQRKVLRDLEQTGIIIQKEDRVIPTREGFLMADHLPLLFY